MADYDWGKPCCGLIVGHKDDCPDHPIKRSAEMNRKRMDKKLATEAVEESDDKPEQWNTEWDKAYELGLKHGIERERARLDELIEDFRQRVNEV